MYDFVFLNYQGAMTTEQLKNTEQTSNEIVSRREAVYATEAALAAAKDVQGLRAIFEEVWHIFSMTIITLMEIKSILSFI